MMLRPRWIGALVLALALAAGFAWLGQWQLERAVESGKVIDAPSETVLPLSKVAKPGGPITDEATGQLVTLEGSFVPTDYQLLEGRLNKGTAGWWVVAHVTIGGGDASASPVALAVARGWAPDKKSAEAAVARLAAEPEGEQTITGRLVPTEAPEVPTDKKHPMQMMTMSVAALYNLWTGVEGREVYSAYVVEATPPAGLVKIDSPPPVQDRTLNWLNIFYAAEWIIFAGFAVFFWYRLVKDAKEKEDELRELERESAAPLEKVE
jgi:cytochrome oxidase assembly protein ShyY1